MNRKIPLLLLTLFLCTKASAQSINKKKLDNLFDMLQSRGLATGSVAISVNGKIEYQRAVGFAYDTGIPAKTDTRYRIGSVTKMFTAVMVFQLIEEGKLTLAEKLSIYFPQLPNANKITIEHLLYHRSGLHDYTKETNFTEWFDKPKSHEEMLQIIASKGPDFEPGSKADYCNTNFLLLSYIIEKACNMTYAEVLEKRITTKAGLKNTYTGKSNKNESGSYKYADSSWRKEKETDLGIHAGAGSIVSTPADLVKFIEELFAQKLISQRSLDLMKTMKDGYGMGIFPYDFDNKTGFGHNGRIEEFYSALRYYPEKKLAVSYITNGILYPRNDIIDGILKICFNNSYTIPFSNAINNDLDQYTGEYSSPDLPFTIVCKKNKDRLLFEAAGKTMEAEPVSTHYFMNLKTGSFFSFDPQKKQLQIKETDNVYTLFKLK